MHSALDAVREVTRLALNIAKATCGYASRTLPARSLTERDL